MKQLAILVSLLCAAAPACAASRNIHENVDPYTGLKTLFLEVSTRTCPGDPSPGAHDPEVHLLFTAMQNNDHTVSYFLAPELDEAGYTLNLRAKSTMDTLIDGEVGVLTTPAGSTTTNRFEANHTYLHETIPFMVTPSGLARLSTADWFQFRINGQRYAVQRCTDAKRMRDLAEFLDAASEYGLPELSANPQPKPILEEISPSTHLKKLMLPNIPTQPCPDDPSPDAQAVDARLAISANQREDGGVWYFITTDLSHGATLSLKRGGNMPVQVDGVTGSYHSINGSNLSYEIDATGNQIPHETTPFHVHQQDIVALNKAARMEFTVTGPTGPVRRCVGIDQFRYLGDFIRIAMTYQPSHMAAATPPAPR